MPGISPFNTIVGVDTETTGKRAWKNGICEIGAIAIDKKGNELDYFHAYCNPGDVEYDEEALKINNLTKEFIQSQRPIEEVLREFIPWMYKYTGNWKNKSVVVGNNFAFDMSFFNFAFDKHVPDLNKQTDWMFHKLDDLKGVSRMVFPEEVHIAQGKLGTKMQVENENAHSALGDVRQMLALYCKLMKINFERINIAYNYFSSRTFSEGNLKNV